MVNLNKTSRNNPEQEKTRKKHNRAGIYMGEVISTKDVSRTGRIRVFVASLGKDKSTSSGNFDCIWVSPFAGGTDYSQIQRDDTRAYEGTQQTYGLWMVPPDIGNIVLVAFGDGLSKFPLCMGCLFPDHYNYMIPGMPSGKAWQGPEARLPVAEKNKFDPNLEHGPDTLRPAHHDFAEALTKQGLINDTLRGPSTSGAKRESPSQVFGFLSPGPLDPETQLRSSGHQLVFDDSVENRQIRIRSAGGGQVLIDDTTGTFYCINSPGTAWFEMTPQGGFNFFGEGDINIRAKKNFNIRADRNVNIEAGTDVNIRAAGDDSGLENLAKDVIAGKVKNEINKAATTQLGEKAAGQLGGVASGLLAGLAGAKGSIRLDAAGDITQRAKLNTILTSVVGNFDLTADGHISATSLGPKGIILHAPLGSLKTNSLRSTSIRTGNFVVSAKLTASFQASIIFLNSGGLRAPKIINPFKTLAPTIKTSNYRDQSSVPPQYDRVADQALMNGGMRSTRGPNIKSIVTSMVTAEPFIGHTNYNPLTDIPDLQVPDAGLNIANNAIDDSGIPADIDSPDGFVKGLPDGKLSSVVNKVKSNFDLPANKDILALPNLAAVTEGLTAAIPLICSPTLNSAKQTLVGAGKILSESETQLSQIAVNGNGLSDQLTNPAFNKINSAITSVKNLSETEQIIALADQSIEVSPDGPGKIYQDMFGNKIVDFKNGMGEIGSTVGLLGDINKTSKTVGKLVSVPLSDNQFIALTCFASHIGSSKFANSEVLQTVNNGEYAKVPTQMQGWQLGSTSKNSTPQRREEYVQRRQFEGELFATPDWVNIDFTSGATQTKSFGQLRHELMEAKNSSNHIG